LMVRVIGVTDHPNPKKVKGCIHWLDNKCISAEFRLSGPLFESEQVPDDFRKAISNIEIKHGYVESCLSNSNTGDTFQFERNGYFCRDPDSDVNKLVFNLAASLRSSYNVAE